MESKNKKIGFVTYAAAPQITSDDQLLLAPLGKLGIDVQPLVWDASSPLIAEHQNEGLKADASAGEPFQQVDWAALILRSPWNYHLKEQEFRHWVNETAKKNLSLFNTQSIVEWNLNKRYLLELASQGVAIPTTTYCRSGSVVDVSEMVRNSQEGEIVIKPEVSLSAYKTWKISKLDAARVQSEVEELLKTTGVLVQDFIPTITTHGEVSLIYFANKFSHAVRKRPKPGDFRVQADFGGQHERVQPTIAMIKLGQSLLKHVDETLLYARVDLVETEQGPLLMELELIDPAVFLGFDAQAADRFALAIKDFVG